MGTTDRRKRSASAEPGTALVTFEPSPGIPLLHVLRQAKDHVDRQTLPPRAVMLRGRQIRSQARVCTGCPRTHASYSPIHAQCLLCRTS